MFTVVEFLEGAPAQRASLRQALILFAHAMQTRKLGCHQFDIGQDDIDGNSYLVYQVYETKAAHLAHLELPIYAEHRLLVDPWIATRRTLTYELVSAGGVA
jgi:quinol monooxygenase YgiN